MKTPLPASLLCRVLETVLLPPVCSLCGLRALGNGLDLCEICVSCLPAAAPATVLAAHFDRVLVPFVYTYPIDHFVRALKFRGERRYARVLGTLIAQSRVQSGAPLPRALIPMPLHLSRLGQRGFNQAHELARYAGALLGIPVMSGLLVRTRSTSEQSRLDLNRRRLNVLGAFGLRAAMPVQAHLALIDDVVTTGSTAAEAAICLRAGGAQRVELWAAACAPRTKVQGIRSLG